jgi:hypothetical protein
MAQAAEAKASKVELKNFNKPDEAREFPKGRLELIKVGGATIGRATSSLVGAGRHRCSRSPRRGAARPRIFSTTWPAC